LHKRSKTRRRKERNKSHLIKSEIRSPWEYRVRAHNGSHSGIAWIDKGKKKSNLNKHSRRGYSVSNRLHYKKQKGRQGMSAAVKELVELVDIFPTLSELAGLPIPTQCPENSNNVTFCTEGTSMVPLIHRSCELRSFHHKNKPARNMYPQLPKYKFTKIYAIKNKKGFSHSRTHVTDKHINDIHLPRLQPDIQWKSAVFSQYPRPSDTPVSSSDKPRLKHIRIMGYSMRTKDYRYTEWVGFDHVTFTMDWSDVHARELYLRTKDPQENVNVAGFKQYAALVEALSKQLHLGWREAAHF